MTEPKRPLPEPAVTANVRDFGAVGDGEADDSEAFLAAIEAARGGALEIPPGRYRITRQLDLGAGDVVLRGAGREATVLYFPLSLYEAYGEGAWGGPYGYAWGTGWIQATGGWEDAARPARVMRAAKRGDRTVEVDDASGFSAGDLVRLAAYEASDGSLSRSIHADHELNGPCIIAQEGHRSVDWVTTVESVEGRRVTFTRPLRVEVRPEWRPELHPFLPLSEEVGVEHLTIEFPPTEYNGHHNEPGYNAIEFRGVFHGWVRDVRVTNFDTAVFFWYARHAEARDLLLDGRGGHYAFNLGGCQDCLVTEFDVRNVSVHGLSFSNLANGNVYSRGRGPSLNFDFHRGAAYENLFSDIHVGNGWRGGRRLWEQSGTPSGHYTAARETFWNTRPQLAGLNLPVDWPQANFIGPIKQPPEAPGGNDPWIEPIDELRPSDLHAAQLARRLGRPYVEPEPVRPAPPPRKKRSQ